MQEIKISITTKRRNKEMPYKFETEKKKIPRELNKNVKLSLEQREEIKELYGLISQRQLAKKFNVSRRLIIFIGCPEKYKKNVENFKKRQKTKKYYNKEKQRIYIQRLRQHKKQLNKIGKLN
jgi:hypothetical protein